jgi:hypothetical protein
MVQQQEASLQLKMASQLAPLQLKMASQLVPTVSLHLTVASQCQFALQYLPLVPVVSVLSAVHT